MSLFTSLKTAANTSVQLGSGLQYHAQNLSSANDPDYQRAEVKYLYTGGFINLGVPERAHDRGISRELLLQRGTAGESETLQKHLASLSGALGLDGSTPHLTDAFEQFVQSWRDLQANPALDSARSIVVDAGENLAQEITSLSFSLSNLRNDVDTAISGEVREANRLLREIGRLNARIANSKAQKTPTVTLENQRDSAINTLSSIVALQTSTSDSGVVSLYTRSGHLLLGTGNPRELAYDSVNREISIGDSTNIIADNDANKLSSGSLRANFNLLRDGATNTQDNDDAVALIAKYELVLDDFVTSLTSSTDTTSFNEAFERNTNAPTYTFFTPDATRNNIQVLQQILDDPLEVPIDAVQTSTVADNVIDVLGLETRNINNGDLVARLQQTNNSYIGLVNGFTGFLGQTINDYDIAAQTDILVRDGLKEQLINRTGVNADEELTHIQQLQTLYAANARVITTLNSMFDELLRTV